MAVLTRTGPQQTGWSLPFHNHRISIPLWESELAQAAGGATAGFDLCAGTVGAVVGVRAGDAPTPERHRYGVPIPSTDSDFALVPAAFNPLQ